MYVNGKMRSVEILPGMGEGKIKENDGGGKFNYDIRTFVNVATLLQHNNKINKCQHEKNSISMRVRTLNLLPFLCISSESIILGSQ
jgi:hypothetical protein